MSKPQVPDRNPAHTNGWDSVFAINFDTANKALQDGWSRVDDSVKTIQTETEGFGIDGKFVPWQLTLGGDGKNIRMSCVFAEGSTYKTPSDSYDLAPKGKPAADVTIEVGMAWVPDPNQKSFVISDRKMVDGIKSDLDQSEIDSALRQAFSHNGINLSDQAAARVITPGKEWHIADGDATKKGFFIFFSQDKQSNRYLDVYQYKKSWQKNLKVLAEAVSENQPAVNVVAIANNPVDDPIAGPVLSELASKWFNANIAGFNHVFALLDIAPALSKDDKYAWLKPTSTSYAVMDNGALSESIFGVLTMAENRPAGTNHQVSQNAIPTGAEANGADAGFLIRGPEFVKRMLLPGAQHIFNGAPADSFEIINDHLTVQNTKKVVWGKFMLDNHKKFTFAKHDYPAGLDAEKIPDGVRQAFRNWAGDDEDDPIEGYHVEVTEKGSQWLLTTGKDSEDEYILDLSGDSIKVYLATIVSIDKGGFKMSLVHSYIEIEFVGLEYSYSSDFNVSANYTEQVVLNLKKKGGKQIFWFDQVLKNLEVNVSKTKSAITREIVEGAVTGVLALIAVAGPIVEGLSEAADVTELSEDAGTAVIDEEAFASVEEENPEEAEEDAQETGRSAGQQLKGKLTNIKRAFGTPKWKVASGIAGLSGAIAGFDAALSAIAEAAAKDQWENVPGFDDFANAVIEPYSFPSTKGFELKSAWLAESLQIGLKTK